jgi:hypothetical protein
MLGSIDHVHLSSPVQRGSAAAIGQIAKLQLSTRAAQHASGVVAAVRLRLASRSRSRDSEECGKNRTPAAHSSASSRTGVAATPPSCLCRPQSQLAATGKTKSRPVSTRSLIVLNRIAKAVVEAQRGIHSSRVFTYRGNPTTRMLNKAWLRARRVAALPQVRVHDLKHTFGRRLRSAGVSFEDRQDLLGHRSARITTHYSAAELSKLLEAEIVCANRMHGNLSSSYCVDGWRPSSRKTHARSCESSRALRKCPKSWWPRAESNHRHKDFQSGQ